MHRPIPIPLHRRRQGAGQPVRFEGTGSAVRSAHSAFPLMQYFMYVCMCVLSPGKLCNIVVVSSAPRKFLLPSNAEGPTQTTSQYEVRAAWYTIVWL